MGGRGRGGGDAKTIISPNTSFGDIINTILNYIDVRINHMVIAIHYTHVVVHGSSDFSCLEEWIVGNHGGR